MRQFLNDPIAMFLIGLLIGVIIGGIAIKVQEKIKKNKIKKLIHGKSPEYQLVNGTLLKNGKRKIRIITEKVS